MQSIGKAIKIYRDKNNLTQEKFGNMIGVNKQTICKWEKGVAQPSTNKYFEIEQIIGSLLDDKPPFVYEKRTKYNVGINFLYENISDFYSLYMFLDSIIVAHDLLKKSGYMGFILFDKTYDDETDENILTIESIELSEDFILVMSSNYQLKIFKDTFLRIEKDVSFNNESYCINCFAKEDKQHFIQLIIDLGNYE